MIEFDRVSKAFPGVRALRDVSFSVRPGECHAVLGENGAGKSTLGKILAGLYRPDSGVLKLDGQPRTFLTPRDAARAGVGIVHQELVFAPNLSVAENLLLHDLPRTRFGLDTRALRSQARSLLEVVGLAVDVMQPLGSLSIAQEQLVQIASVVGSGARVLVFDEPTSSLGRNDSERLFGIIRRLQARGATCLYVSHRLEEIFALCQAVTVLRDGAHVETARIEEVDRDRLVSLMVGRPVEAVTPRRRVSAEWPASASGTSNSGGQPSTTPIPALDKRGSPNPAPSAAQSPARLEVRDLRSPGRIDGVSFAVRAGEIVGLAGLVGSGRTEIVEALQGLDPAATGSVLVDGRPLPLGNARRSLQAGLALVPEDRKRQGLVLGMSVAHNLTLSVLDRLRWLGDIIARRREAELVSQSIARLRVRTPSAQTVAATLSGGNQQKVVFAKGLATSPRVLLVDEPTRGVDVGAKQEIHSLLFEAAEQGVAVLVVSSDLPELLATCDRLLVVRDHRLVGELTPAEFEPENVLRCMGGYETTAVATGSPPGSG